MDENIILWDLKDPLEPKPIGQPMRGQVMAFSPDGNTLAIGSYDSPVYLTLWDIRNPEAPEELSNFRFIELAPILSLVFSADGQILVSGDYGGNVVLWDVSIANELTQIGQLTSAHKDLVYSIAISPDMQTLVSGSADRTIRVWNIIDLEMPTPIGQPFIGHTDAVLSVTFSPDGNNLVSGGADGTIILWNININQLNSYACRLVGRNLTQDEWSQFLPEDEVYKKTCPDLP